MLDNLIFCEKWVFFTRMELGIWKGETEERSVMSSKKESHSKVVKTVTF